MPWLSMEVYVAVSGGFVDDAYLSLEIADVEVFGVIVFEKGNFQTNFPNDWGFI